MQVAFERQRLKHTDEERCTSPFITLERLFDSDALFIARQILQMRFRPLSLKSCEAHFARLPCRCSCATARYMVASETLKHAAILQLYRFNRLSGLRVPAVD